MTRYKPVHYIAHYQYRDILIVFKYCIVLCLLFFHSNFLSAATNNEIFQTVDQTLIHNNDALIHNNNALWNGLYFCIVFSLLAFNAIRFSMTRLSRYSYFMLSLLLVGSVSVTAYSMGFKFLGHDSIMLMLSFGLVSLINILSENKHCSEKKAIMAHAEQKAKSDFLAKMSHEIRTPMNGVLGMAELLKGTVLDKTQQHYLEVIYGSGQALLRVLNDILDHSKIEAGDLSLDNISFDLENLMDECIAIFSFKSEEKQVSLLSSIHPGTPTLLIGDPVRLRQIIINLLGNAFKFTDEGEVVVRAYSTNQGSRDIAIIRFEIEDTGVGIPEEVHNHIFRHFGGTGIGLSISKQLAELMNGAIGVKSTVGKGSCFWFTAQFEIPVQNALVLPVQTRELDGLNLLVIDQHHTLCQIIREQATSWGMNVTVSSTPSAALKKIDSAIKNNTPYDIAMLNLNLPEMSGLELAKTIKRNPAHQQVKIVLMSSLRILPEQTILSELGIEFALGKPISSRQLRTSLAKAAGATIEPETPQDFKIKDYSHLNILVAEDNKVNQMVVKGMMKKLGVIAQYAENGVQAVDVYKKSKGILDLIFMDCDMPELDGFDATTEIRRLEKKHNYDKTIIMALSAHILEEHKTHARSVGMDDFINKPVEIKTMLNKLDQWFPQE